MEDKVENLNNCVVGKHTYNSEIAVIYSWNEDYSECSAKRNCIYCENDIIIETALLDTSNGYAEFETEGLER